MRRGEQGPIEAVLVPLLQALVTGLLASLAAVAAWQAYHQPRAWYIFLAGLAVFTCGAWLVALSKWRVWMDAFFGVETPQPAPAPPAPYQLKIDLRYNEQAAGDFLDLPVDYQRFEAWCAGVTSGKSLGENHWTGARGAFTKAEYHKLLDELQARGLVRLRGRHYSSGYELTGKGRALAGELSRRNQARLSPSTRVYNPGLSDPREDCERARGREGHP